MCSLLHIWRIAIVSSSDQNTLHSQALLASSDGLCLFFQAALCCVWQVKRSEMVRQRVRSTWSDSNSPQSGWTVLWFIYFRGVWVNHLCKKCWLINLLIVGPLKIFFFLWQTENIGVVPDTSEMSRLTLDLQNLWSNKGFTFSYTETVVIHQNEAHLL